MADQNKVAKAKLYNLKSGVEGLISMLEAGVMDGHQTMAGVMALVDKASRDFAEQVDS